MIVLSHFCIASLIFMLDDEVDALKSSSFELINLIVEYLQTSDADDSHIVGRVRNLHTEGESTDENLRKLATRHEPNIALIICLLASETSENAQNHAHERAHYLHFLKDASYSLVLPRQLKLIITKFIVQRYNVRSNNSLNPINGRKQLLNTNLDCQLIDFLFHQGKHRLGEYEACLQAIGNHVGGTIGDLLRSVL